MGVHRLYDIMSLTQLNDWEGSKTTFPLAEPLISLTTHHLVLPFAQYSTLLALPVSFPCCSHYCSLFPICPEGTETLQSGTRPSLTLLIPS